MKFLKRFFSKLPPKTIDPPLNKAVVAQIEYQIATLEMQAAAKNEAGPSVILTPIVPLNSKDVGGWFGGAARLPRDVVWPEIDGVPYVFLAQIDLKHLPQNIWAGVGPRDGYFAFFLDPKTGRAKVLHVHGVLERRWGPSPASAFWFRKQHGMPEANREYFPEWPVRLDGNVGELPEPVGWYKGKAPRFPDPFKDETFDLTNPAHRPFDEATLKVLIQILDRLLEKTLGSTEMLLQTKKLRSGVRDELEALRADVTSSYERFRAIKESLEPFCSAFDGQGIEPHLHALSNLSFGHTTYSRDDEKGNAEIEVCSGKLVSYALGFLTQIEPYAKRIYLDDPERLPVEVRRRFEALWEFTALHERGGMSHPPKGMIYTPHGPSTPNEVLLELPTSDLIGWVWGDLYSVVFTIAREDLANGKLDNIIVDITN